MTSPFEWTWLGDGVGSFHIVTDERPHFALGDLDALRSVTRAIAGDERVRAVVIEGGSRQFCAGADLETLLRPDAAETIHALVGEVARIILSIPVPTVASMAGHAIGGGFVVGLWCDVTVFAAESLYSANFVQLGFTPGMGSTAVLAETFGAPLARELLLTGRALKGSEMKTLAPPLAHAVVPRAEVRARALALAHELADPPPAAVRLYKARASAERRAMLERALADERRMHLEVFSRSETRAHIAGNYIAGSGE